MCKVLLRLGSKLAASWAAATTPLSLPTALVGHTNDPPAASACKDMVPTAPAAKQSKREGRGQRAGQGRAGQGRAGRGGALQRCTRQAALERQDLSCTNLAHHELGRVLLLLLPTIVALVI